MDTSWRIEMLGGLRATRGRADEPSAGAQVVTRFRTRKAASLLAYLAYNRHRAHPRELLVELLWPECPPGNGHGNLSRELTWLRRRLELPPMAAGTVILADRHAVQASPVAVSSDVADFEAALRAARAERGPERARRLTAAVTFYRGELLPGSGEAWVVPERLRLADAFLDAMHELVVAREEAGDRRSALQLAWRAAAADPLREETHADLVRLLVAAGQQEAAAHQCRERERFLEREPHGRDRPCGESRSSSPEQAAERSRRVRAAEAEELRRQLALRTAEADDLRQRLQSEMAETQRLRQELAAGSSRAGALGRQPGEGLDRAGITRA